MSYVMFLDDIRRPSDVSWPLLCADGRRLYMNEIMDLGNYGCRIVRNYFEFCEFIKYEGIPEVVFFDHDLAPEHYAACNSGSHQYGGEKTGADCARWLVDHCYREARRLPQYYIHSMNPDGAENIRSILETAKKVLPELS